MLKFAFWCTCHVCQTLSLKLVYDSSFYLKEKKISLKKKKTQLTPLRYPVLTVLVSLHVCLQFIVSYVHAYRVSCSYLCLCEEHSECSTLGCKSMSASKTSHNKQILLRINVQFISSIYAESCWFLQDHYSNFYKHACLLQVYTLYAEFLPDCIGCWSLTHP